VFFLKYFFASLKCSVGGLGFRRRGVIFLLEVWCSVKSVVLTGEPELGGIKENITRLIIKCIV
jgi:hypothetical protein